MTINHLKHELRTPINQIIGFAEMLIEESDGAETRQRLQPLLEVCDAARQFVNVMESVLAGQNGGAAGAEMLESLRAAASTAVQKMEGAGVGELIPPADDDLKADLTTIVKAIGRLADFAGTGSLAVGGRA